MMREGSFQGARTMGADPPTPIAMSMGTVSEWSMRPCWLSTQT